MRAIQITEFGSPADVVRVVDLPEPPAPGPGEVKVAVELSPLNKHDLLLLSGELLRLLARQSVQERFQQAAKLSPQAAFDLELNMGERIGPRTSSFS